MWSSLISCGEDNTVIIVGVALANNQKNPDGIRGHIWALLLGLSMTFFTLFHSLVFKVAKRLPDSLADQTQFSTELEGRQVPEELDRPPSPAPEISKTALLSSVLTKLDELEGKVDTLQAKPHEMPCEKEELLNAAVCRVDALEAELISTKKVLLPILCDAIFQ